MVWYHTVVGKSLAWCGWHRVGFIHLRRVIRYYYILYFDYSTSV